MTVRYRVRRAAALGAVGVGLLAPLGVAARQAEPPPPLPARPIEFPGFEELMLDNGIRVVLVSYGTQPVASARLYMRGGRSTDPPELSGLASMAATLLTRGTSTRSAPEISAAIEGVGGTLSATAGQDFLNVSAVVLTGHLDLAFELVADVVRNPTFPDEELELARSQMLSGLQAELGNPQAIASRTFSSILYGDEHPYGVAPTPESVRRIRGEDLTAYRDRVLRPEGALLLVAGLVSREEVEELASRHLGGWEGAPVSAPPIPAARELDATRVVLVHRPGASQSVVVVGHLGIEADDPDYFPLVVTNRILGGGADSRLFQILREERGWTYSTFSQFTRSAGRGHVMAQAEVRSEVTDSTVVEMLDQLRRLRDETVPQPELDGARSFLAGSFPLRLETADQVAGQLAGTLLLGLPLEDVTRYPERVRAVTGADVQRTAREHVHPDRAAVVVVGDGTQLLERLEAIAPVELFDVDGSPLAREEVLGGGGSPPWNGERLEPGERTYEVVANGSPAGSATYRLERDAEDWVSTVTVAASGTTQRTRLRFSALDFGPREVSQVIAQGPVQIDVEVTVTNGRLVGRVELPAALGGARDYDEELAPGTLLAGMDEYALAASDLSDGASFALPYFDLTQGETVPLRARVTGSETVTVPAGSFDTWRVEVTGGSAPVVLFLRQEAPHILVRQELAGPEVRLDLVTLTR